MLAGIVTLLLIITFLSGWAWLWRPSRRKHFEAASRLPLDDEQEPRA